MRCRARSLVWIGLLAGLIACGGDDETTPAPPPATPTVQRLVAGVCDLTFRCCERGEVNYLIGPYVDEHDCVSRLIAASTLTSASFELATFSGPTISLPNLAGLERAVEERRVEVDTAAMDACVAYLTALECATPEDKQTDACLAPKPGVGSTPCDAEALFIGRVEKGGACTSTLLSLECAAGLACARDSELGVTGECVPAGRIGDSCFSDLECGIHVNEGELAEGQNRREKLYCSQADGTCQKLRREGETCRYADDEDLAPDPATLLIRCVPGLSCDPVTDLCVAVCQRGAPCVDDESCDADQKLLCIGGRCDSLREEGAPCSWDHDCVPPLGCAASPVEPSKHVCAKRLPIGDPCLGHSDCDSTFCDPITHRCTAQVKAGGLCPTGQDAQCELGVCTSDFLSCYSNADCPGSNKCDLGSGQCAYYCVALKPDGATCISESECASQQCIVGFCRTPPLAEGVGCEYAEQCDSQFCSLDSQPVCKKLPLPLGEPCSANEQCESEVCFDSGGLQPTCVNGLGEGEACGAFGQAPCNPKFFYCNDELDPRACAPLKKTGEDCKSEVQCRGECAVKFDRKMCFPPGDPTMPMCDGGESDAEASK